jgi:glycine dehydrogenase
MRIDLSRRERFAARHIGPDRDQTRHMLAALGTDSMDTLIRQTVPDSIRLGRDLDLPPATDEARFLEEFKQLASRNRIVPSYIGLGYTDTLTPPVILRNILENPGWYTAYTPYQAEIAQGRLEMLLNYQTMVMQLTGMEIANASLLDEATAAAEAMTLLHACRPGSKKEAHRFYVSETVFPQTLALLKTRAIPIGIDLVVGAPDSVDVTDPALYGMLLQNPDQFGAVSDLSALIAAAHEHGVTVAVATDLLACTMVTPPGEMGADVVVGSAQRFGVPMGFGGPHAAFFATRDAYKRHLPGRIIGVSIDAQGNPAYRMALQTREQHIRREKATSNICTAQVLLSVMAAAYGVYHGPQGLTDIAHRTYGLTTALAYELQKMGVTVVNKVWFDTLRIDLADAALRGRLLAFADAAPLNLRHIGATEVGATFDEAKTLDDLITLVRVFADATGKTVDEAAIRATAIEPNLPDPLVRRSAFMTHPVFNTHHSEHEMLRYLKKLENKDLSLAHSMISLGSCTMKLNATTEMIPVTWPEFGKIHPFAPESQTEGYREMMTDLESWLCDITGFHAVSLQPNSGAQGEFAGLMVIRAWHEHRGEGHRTIALIPNSAHGTNPASAVMAGMQVVVVACDARGNIDLADLRAKADQHATNLACLMVTYPSTHGVFEEEIRDICAIIHERGGQVYMDGANMNAQVGLTSPAAIGADVCHLNLHKTFCIPHGGGGPGMGPIGVVEHLAPFLPGHPVVKTGGLHGITPISAAPWGSASILTISYAYIRLMGADGLKKATEFAILNANYMKARLEAQYPVLYSGRNGRCAHEFILDLRPFKAHGIEVEDVAKRLMDYGFHAPTVSFPVAGTLMIEPTESEPLGELDRFCDAMLSIRAEIQEVIDGKADKSDNVLKHAPHTAGVLLATDWTRPYTREQAAFPLAWVKDTKFWPSVSRIDGAHGDRNLVCSCLPMEAYATV